MYHLDKINQKLQNHVHNTIKRDQQAHGTYSINAFAFYPKNLRNTVMNLL